MSTVTLKSLQDNDYLRDPLALLFVTLEDWLLTWLFLWLSPVAFGGAVCDYTNKTFRNSHPSPFLKLFLIPRLKPKPRFFDMTSWWQRLYAQTNFGVSPKVSTKNYFTQRTKIIRTTKQAKSKEQVKTPNHLITHSFVTLSQTRSWHSGSVEKSLPKTGKTNRICLNNQRSLPGIVTNVPWFITRSECFKKVFEGWTPPHDSRNIEDTPQQRVMSLRSLWAVMRLNMR
jgi:hypothetical protein